MGGQDEFEIFLMTAPGLEPALLAEARELGFQRARPVKGGVTFIGTWHDAWRANLELRGAARVLARIAEFRVLHLAQLDKRAHRVDWTAILRRGVGFRVEATCKGSRIYHSGAAAERVATAIADATGGVASDDAEVCVRVRIEDDVCQISIDTSGDLLHKRGFKVEVGKAPMRETLAALLLRQCGFDGSEPVLDPMCGSGTFVIEAAEIAAGLQPGRARRFAFEQLATFDAAAWQNLTASCGDAKPPQSRFHGSDRDAGAVAMSRANAERAGVAAITDFQQMPVSEIAPPSGPAGLVIVNPPYGDRIGDVKRLTALYRSLGQVLMSRFAGWRVGLVTSEQPLARATGLPFAPPGPPIAHGGLKVRLYRTAILK